MSGDLPVGRVTPLAPQPAGNLLNGAHGVTRPTRLRDLFVSVLGTGTLTDFEGSSVGVRFIGLFKFPIWPAIGTVRRSPQPFAWDAMGA